MHLTAHLYGCPPSVSISKLTRPRLRAISLSTRTAVLNEGPVMYFERSHLGVHCRRANFQARSMSTFNTHPSNFRLSRPMYAGWKVGTLHSTSWRSAALARLVRLTGTGYALTPPA